MDVSGIDRVGLLAFELVAHPLVFDSLAGGRSSVNVGTGFVTFFINEATFKHRLWITLHDDR